MTDDRATPAPGEHLDDDATLDAVDGTLAPAGATHLETCDACRAEVAAQLAVRDALAAAPPAVAPEVRESAIAAALAAWDAEAATPAPPQVLDAHRRRRRPAPTYGWLGAAAVVLLLVVALPLLALAGGGSDDSGEMSTAAGGGDAAGDGSEAVEEGASTMAAPGPVDVGDLGALEPGEDLRPVVDRALGLADPDNDITTLDVPDTATGPAQESARDDAGAAEDDSGTELVEEAAGGPCVAAVREDLTDLGALVLVGAATVEGNPVRVLGFEAPTTARPSVVVVVVAEEGCEVRTFQSHAEG